MEWLEDPETPWLKDVHKKNFKDASMTLYSMKITSLVC